MAGWFLRILCVRDRNMERKAGRKPEVRPESLKISLHKESGGDRWDGRAGSEEERERGGRREAGEHLSVEATLALPASNPWW